MVMFVMVVRETRFLEFFLYWVTGVNHLIVHKALYTVSLCCCFFYVKYFYIRI